MGHDETHEDVAGILDGGMIVVGSREGGDDAHSSRWGPLHRGDEFGTDEHEEYEKDAYFYGGDEVGDVNCYLHR